MKKISISLVIVCILLILAACGSNESSSNNESDQKNGSSENSSGASMNIDFSLFSSESDAFSVIFREWADRVEEATEGRIQITPYYAGQLTSLFDTLDSVKNGTVDGGLLSAGAISGQIPDMSILELEAVFEGEEHFQKVYNESLDLVDEIFTENGVKMAFWALGSTQGVTVSTDEFLTDPEQYKGKKFRTAGKWQALQMEAAGATPITMDPGELYLALQNKTVDATDQTVSLAKAFKLHEVAPKMVLRKVTANAVMYVFNPDVWEQISPEDQETILNVSKEVGLESWKILEEEEEKALQTMSEEGAEIYELTEEELEKIKGVVTSVLPEVIDSMGEKGRKLNDIIEESK